MAGLSYMQRRRSGTYEFRKRLPTEIAGQPAPDHLSAELAELVNPKTGRFKSEIVRSLGTSDYREAKRRDLGEARKALALFDAAMRALANGNTVSITHSAGGATADLALIEAETVAELLAADETERSDGDDRRRLQTREERAQWPDLVPIAEPWAKGMAEEHAFAYGIELEELASEYREANARHDPGIVRAETHAVLRRHGIPINPTSALYHEVGTAVLRAHVRAFDAMLRRQRGDVVDTPPPPAVAKKRAAETRGPKLSEAFAAWQEGSSAARNAKKPTPRTILEARVAVRWFTELHGDMRLGEITKSHAREFQRAIAKVSRSRAANLRSLPLPKLIEHTSRKPASAMRSATTINKSINMLAAITSFAQREGLLDEVPGSYVSPFGKDVKLIVDRRDEETREPFAPSDLAAIFASGVFTRGERPLAGCGEAAFWYPIIALLSGMRLEEIAGLRLGDLAQDEETGRWYFDVNTHAGRSVKTASSVRKVPLHPELVRIGLLRYRQSLSGTTSLWPRLTARIDGRPISYSGRSGSAGI
jgi:integrase